jgi:hypothetical protein
MMPRSTVLRRVLALTGALWRSLRGGAEVLRRPWEFDAELVSRVHRPVRIAQQFSREQHAIGLATLDDRVGLPGVGNQADRPVAMSASRLMRSANGT